MKLSQAALKHVTFEQIKIAFEDLANAVNNTDYLCHAYSIQEIPEVLLAV
jgi:hypothetical protein